MLINAEDHYVVVGLGITGLSVIQYLTAKGCNNITITDTRCAPPKLALLQAQYPLVTSYFGKLAIPKNTNHIILSPGISRHDPKILRHAQNGCKVYGDIELYARACTRPIIAVTGSNGKSTVVSVLYNMAKASGLAAGLGGNIGTPALSLLQDKTELDILELSSFQLETLYSLRPDIATILNIMPDHMDRYNNITCYQQAKHRIYQHAKTIIYNRDNKLTQPFNKQSQQNIISFGLDKPINAKQYGIIQKNGRTWCARGNKTLIATNAIAMLGEQNIANALVALSIGEYANFSLDAMLAVLQSFNGLAHRTETIATINQVLWINDSKGTNVGATVAALQGLSHSIINKWIIILGGDGKNADFTPLLQPVLQYCKVVILIGATQNILAALFNTLIPCVTAIDLHDVVIKANNYANPGDGVLFSPACASFDMFDNYLQRGNMFKQAVVEHLEHE